MDGTLAWWAPVLGQAQTAAGSFTDGVTFWLIAGVVMALSAAAIGGLVLRRQTELGINPAAVEQFNLRIQAWWVLFFALAASFLFTRVATIVLFGLISFWALREFITLTPTRPADHRTLFWVFILFTPLQYVLVGLDAYRLFGVLIPVFAFLFIPARIALAGDYKRYLERCAKIQAGLMICVYCLSHAPAVLNLRIPGYQQNARLLFFFVLVVVSGDAFQYACEKILGKHLIAPAISQHRTWEGFLGGLGCGTLFGTALSWATPFNPLLTAAISMTIVTLGFAGGMTMSAIKRDRGVKDYGTLIEGHGGILDRIDSLCFAAPVFYYITRWIAELSPAAM